MHNFRRIVKAGIFLLLVILINGGLDYALYPYTYSRAEMHHMEKREVNQLIVGTSHGKCGIDPAILDEILGTKTFNSCQGGEYPIDSYYLIKEANRVHDIKRVIYELDPGYWVTGDGQNAQYISYIREFPISGLKFNYWKDKLLDGDFRSTFFPWYFYRNQVKNVGEIINRKRSDEYKNYSFAPFDSTAQTCRKDGFIKRNRIETEKAPVDPMNLWQDDNVNPTNVEWFERLYGYCKEKKIQLTVVVTPVPEETYALYPENYKRAYEYLGAYMKDKELLYLNYNLTEADDYSRSIDNFADQEGHMYGDAAEKFSRCLARDLQQCK